MKILHVVESFSTGVLQAISAICGSITDGSEFLILHGTREELPPDFARYFPPSTTFSAWNAPRNINMWEDYKAYRELSALVKDWKPDIIHAHSTKAGAISRLLAFNTEASIIYSPHGYSFLRRDVPYLTRMFYRSIEAALGHAPHVTVACGEAELIEASRVSSTPILIPNTIDISELDRIGNIAPRHEKLRISMMGGIRPQKNFPLFVNIAARFTDQSIDFVWVGGGDIPEGIEVPGNVEVTGWLKHEEGLAELARSDIFLQTSLWEGLPIALLEAMALRLPVLATPVPGNAELVVDGVTGFQCRTVNEFETGINRLASSAELRQHMGGAGRALTQRRHTRDAIVSRWSSLYRQLAFKSFAVHNPPVIDSKALRANTNVGQSHFLH